MLPNHNPLCALQLAMVLEHYIFPSSDSSSFEESEDSLNLFDEYQNSIPSPKYQPNTPSSEEEPEEDEEEREKKRHKEKIRVKNKERRKALLRDDPAYNNAEESE